MFGAAVRVYCVSINISLPGVVYVFALGAGVLNVVGFGATVVVYFVFVTISISLPGVVYVFVLGAGVRNVVGLGATVGVYFVSSFTMSFNMFSFCSFSHI